ncbi:putative polyketide synthase [Talaromyces proteolyticus]|uniref:Polyketide synthase n=1 Tax=Talaromyces proteolyticus TaxID=1131652 RepID=A0AAD4PTV5_9EURO|nr:putative polyketide synthase [Talaromyces proteolyticus]KAH8689371.1 putative polyketide synthase [Talaromyces proteolyticus]
MDILVCGDQTVDVCPFLVDILIKKRTPLFQAFIRKVKVILENEITLLSSYQRAQIPPFSSLRELVDEYHRRGVHIASLESAFACIAQLAHFIGTSEENPHTYIKPGSRIMGMCIGLLSASAIACCDSLVALIPLAVETIRIAFRLGARVACVAESLEPGQKPWTSLVTGIDSQAVVSDVDSFNKTQALKGPNRLYVSSIASNSTAVSGPPSIRKLLFEDPKLLKSTFHRDLPIYGPYHASHLFLEKHDIISEQSLEVLDSYSQFYPVCGSTFSMSQALFEDSIHQILDVTVDWNSLVKYCSDSITETASPTCRIRAFGPAPIGNSLSSSLKHLVKNGLKLSLDDHASWLSNNSVPSYLSETATGCNIAIIGMAGRFPDAADHEAFWDLLAKGLDVHRVIPPDRFDAEAHTDPSGNGRNKTHTPYGCFIEQPGLFDPRFFNMSPREAKQTDPMQRLAITTAYEAMESSGFVMNRTSSTQANRIGTFYGQTSDDWREINAAENIDTYFITGGVRAFGPGRLNYHFGFSGPSFSIDTACSSSFAAIQLACTSLRAGDCDTVFAGGMNVLTNPDIFAGLSKGQFLSKTGSCKTFDNEADGYCRGDGVATVILKRVEDAIADNDPILAVIRGTATNHSAEAVSITHPHAGAQQYLFQKIMDDLGEDPRDVNYVEMHGTGTQAGDGIEIQSVTNVFAPRGQRRRPINKPLYIGSAKANIGHGEAVSGVSALIKVMLMLQKNLIPPHCGIKGTMNETFPSDLKERGVNIASTLTSFSRAENGQKRLVFINNFSAAGGNSAMLIEDAPHRIPFGEDVRPSQVVTISAKSLASFGKNIERLLSWIDHNRDFSLADLAYTTTARREHYIYRQGFPVESLSQLRQKLESYIQSSNSPSPVSKVPPQVAFVFTGQGAQYSGMGKELFSASDDFRRRIKCFDGMATGQGFPSFISAIDGSLDDLAQVSPIVSQLATTCLQMVLADMWKSWGMKPTAVLGHSLGEYAALYAAGVLSPMDAVFLVAKRAQLLETLCTMHSHLMLAVKGKISNDEMQGIVANSSVEIACFNSVTETVLAGPSQAINEARQSLSAKRPDLRFIELNVPFAFHSTQVDPILDDFEKAAESIIFHPPQVPVLAPSLSTVVDTENIFNANYLRRHARESVDFVGSIMAGMERKTIGTETVWIEIGPHPICSAMIQTTIGPDTTAVASLKKKEDSWKTVASSLSTLYNKGIPINWNEYHRIFEKSVKVLNLPSYAFDEKVYWLEYTNNWTLTKGQITTGGSNQSPKTPEFSTTSIQRIVSESVDNGLATVVAETDLHEPHLKAIICGHKVGGAPLFPSSINADMAYTISKYAFNLVHSDGKEPDMNICNMESSSPLILDLNKTSQVIQIRSEYASGENLANVYFESVSEDGKRITKYAHCVVRFEDAKAWEAEFNRSAYLVNARIKSMQTSNEHVHTIYRGMAYKLFSALVDYSPTFRGMEEVRLDSSNLEAAARIRFQTKPEDGEFMFSPYCIDNTCHVSGFIMNATDAVDSENQIYISHGWETMRFVRKPSIDKEYMSYVKMSPVSEGSTMVSGDVYVLEGEKIVGVFGGVRFQGVPRKLMPTLLGLKNKTSSPNNRPTREVKPSQTTTKKPTQQSKPDLKSSSAASRPSLLISGALDILASEIGCSLSELDDNIAFEDLGVDSLMSLSISSRFREELEIPVGGTLFIDFGSVGQLKTYLSQFESGPGGDVGNIDPTRSESITKVNTPAESEIGDSPNDDEDDQIFTIRSTIAEEMGVDVEEIQDNIDLSQMGMDSLMSLAILGSLRERTGLSFPSDFLIENTTIEQMIISLDLKKKPKQVPTNTINIADIAPKVQDIRLPKQSEIPSINVDLSSYPPSQIILLSGNPRTATRKLFLLPDGSGAAFSYAPIPELDNHTVVYGLNCPFMRTPELFTIGVPAVTKIYMQAIKSRQPEGPYLLGGWSAGGVLAYEMTRQLIAQGERVEKLILVDSPFPIGLEALPPVFHNFCNEIGLLGDGKTKPPEWLLPHFRATVRELTAYSEILETTSLNTEGMPPTTLIWARDGVVKGIDDPKPVWEEGVRMPNSMEWLVNNRKNLGSNGWDKLVGKTNTRCVSMEGNHFTMMRDPLAAEVGKLIKEAMDI